MFENKKTEAEQTYYNRYIASWTKVSTEHGRRVIFDTAFRRWLKEHRCTEDEITEICQLANTGKLELEQDASVLFDTMKGYDKYHKYGSMQEMAAHV